MSTITEHPTTTKHLTGFTVKDATKGEVTAVFSRFNVIDHDGDVTMPDAFTEGQKVIISAFNHTSWNGELPVGKGTIRTDAEVAYLDGVFFMDTPHGKNTFDTVKNLGDQGEWSYSLHDVISERGEWDGKSVNILRKIRVHEVSPVIKGAGIGTNTVDMKVDGLKFAEHAAKVLTLVDEFAVRATEVVTLRTEQGKSIAPETAAVIAQIGEAAHRLPAINPPTKNDEPDENKEPEPLPQAVRDDLVAIRALNQKELDNE